MNYDVFVSMLFDLSPLAIAIDHKLFSKGPGGGGFASDEKLMPAHERSVDSWKDRTEA
jgi:hypothetical protein